MEAIYNYPITVSILVDGRPLPIYEQGGRHFVEGVPGAHYVIRVVPQIYSGRLEVLESVDGRDVLKDQAASLSSAGMVISGPWDNHGWRINDNEVRDFVFGSVADSIAAQAGQPANVGVIGVAAYREKQREYFTGASTFTLSSATYKDSGAMAGSDVHYRSLSADRSANEGQATSSLSADMGTGMGAARADSVGHTTFTRDGRVARIEIQYRSHEWLLAQGIISNVTYPSAFPSGDTGYEKYVK